MSKAKNIYIRREKTLLAIVQSLATISCLVAREPKTIIGTIIGTLRVIFSKNLLS
jgi:hypothetical protein